MQDSPMPFFVGVGAIGYLGYKVIKYFMKNPFNLSNKDMKQLSINEIKQLEELEKNINECDPRMVLMYYIYSEAQREYIANNPVINRKIYTYILTHHKLL
jgi:hypothetical protein